MENLAGLLKIRVLRGINLAVRDTRSSDPYVVFTMGNQKLKTNVVKNSCNPEWNDELTLSFRNPAIPVNVTVYDKDTLSVDDKMGEAEIDIRPHFKCVQETYGHIPSGTVVSRVHPSSNNCLADESCIIYKDGKIIQDMRLRLKNVESGEIELQLEWVNLPDPIVV